MRLARVALVVGAMLLTGPSSWVFAQTASDAYYPFLIARHLEAAGDNQGAQRELERAVAADPRSAEVRAATMTRSESCSPAVISSSFS